MSLAVGVVSSSKSMGLDNNEGAEKTDVSEAKKIAKTPADDEHEGCENSVEATDEEEEEEEYDEDRRVELGPQVSLKEQLEKDKDDESLARWKEQLLGTVDLNSVGETLEPDVKILQLAIKSPGRPDIVLPIPESGNPEGIWFTLKAGSRYSLSFTFRVSNNIVSGLKYTNVVWRKGLKVDTIKEMLGTFSPDTHSHEMPEDTTPSGFLYTGTYSARTKFIDDDNKCYLEMNYSFAIKNDW